MTLQWLSHHSVHLLLPVCALTPRIVLYIHTILRQDPSPLSSLAGASDLCGRLQEKPFGISIHLLG